ncbi:hypothetical protein DIPPA_00570 [Diplonema papillatum]|nr:hypothetical protein DIPPA_00570 [Diplonema papillatum]|eukprot:gene4274-6608_t
MTSQHSMLEAWRRDVKEEDRRITGAAVGTMTETPADFAALKKAASNSRGKSVGNTAVAYEDRVFCVVFFPAEAKTPPCHMYFPRTMLVGKICDRLAAMLVLPPDTRTRLVRLSSHHALPAGRPIGEASLGLHEEVVLVVDGTSSAPLPSETLVDLPCIYPRPTAQEPEHPAAEHQQNEETPPAEADPEPEEDASLLGDVLEGSAGECPEGAKPLEEWRFANKKLQPLGDKAVPGGKRVQAAVFFEAGGGGKAVYAFFNGDHVAGRCVDAALALAQVPNPNLKVVDPSQKLVLYNLRTRRAVPSGAALSSTDVQSGDPLLVAKAGGIPLWICKESVKYTHPAPDFEKKAKMKKRECAVM